jgi:NAD/NADP transhydrogenase alpha subunit
VIVGVLRETAARERRVALVPRDVRRLVDAGLTVVAQEGAGRYAGFADEEYRAAGVRLCKDAGGVFAACDVIAWVKPPAYRLDSLARRAGVTLVGFQDPIRRGEQIAGLRALGVESVAFELVPHSDPAVDALSAMSRIAGVVAYRAGRRLLPRDLRRPIRSVILGCGRAGLSAVAAAAACGDEPPLLVGNRHEQQGEAQAHGPNRFRVNPEGDSAVLRGWVRDDKPDLVLCAAVRRGSRAPILVDDSVLAALGSKAVVVDLVAKAGGNCSATIPDTTLRLSSGVLVTHRSNYPARRPAAASHAYSGAVAAMILRLAQAR